MKKTVKYIILTAVAGAVLASCQREQLPATATGDGPRVISVSFADATKTALDGIQAKFCAGDIILVSNGEELEDCKVGLDDSGNAQITTTLKGGLKAVYPSEAAVHNGYDIDMTQIRVPIAQRGRFKDAHICTSTIAADGSNAIFANRSAILKFYVDKSIGVTSIKVTGAGENIATGSRTITVTAPSGTTLANVTDDPQKRICYVAVLPGVNANQLTFKTEATTQPTLPRTPTTDVTLAAGTLYRAFIPYYVTIGTRKWGYCNVGAFLPEEAGWYFSWGNIDGYVLDGGTWKKVPGRTAGPSGGFSGYNNDPYKSSEGAKLTANIPVNAQYDAAYVHWGSSWRIATNAEFGTLCADCGGTGALTTGGTVDTVAKDIYSCTDYYGVTGALFCDGTNGLFLPAAGVGQHNAITPGGLYISSTWQSVSGFYRLDFDIPGSVTNSEPSNRGDGFPIRPILNDEWHYRDLDDGGTI